MSGRAIFWGIYCSLQVHKRCSNKKTFLDVSKARIHCLIVACVYINTVLMPKAFFLSRSLLLYHKGAASK